MKTRPEYADHCTHCDQPCGTVITLEAAGRYFRRRSDCCGAPTEARPLRNRVIFDMSVAPDWQEGAA